MNVIILRGVSGSGKSTLARKFADLRETEIFSADDFFIDPGTGKYEYNRAFQQAAHNSCFLRYIDAVTSAARGKLIVVDNTNTRAVEIAPYYQLALAHLHPVRVVTILSDPVLAWESNQHHVPLEAIVAQDRRIRNESLPPWWRETIAPRIFVPKGADEDGNITHDDGLIFDPADFLDMFR